MSKILTTASGAPVADNQNSRSAGPRGPLLLDDFHLIEKLAHFNRENIPERRVHAKGSAPTAPLPSIATSPATPAPSCLSRSASKQKPSCASPLSVANVALQTPNATLVALPSSSTPKKATGTLWVITRQCSLFAIR